MRSEEKRDVGGGRMVVEDHGDEADGENETGGDAPPQLEPHGIERYFLAESLSLHVSPVQVVGNDRDEPSARLHMVVSGTT